MAEIRDASGVSLRRLYGLYPSKHDLVAGWLEARHTSWMAWFQAGIRAASTAGAAPVDAIFDTLAEWASTPGYRGCAFLNTAAEVGRDRRPAPADHRRPQAQSRRVPGRADARRRRPRARVTGCRARSPRRRSDRSGGSLRLARPDPRGEGCRRTTRQQLDDPRAVLGCEIGPGPRARGGAPSLVGVGAFARVRVPRLEGRVYGTYSRIRPRSRKPTAAYIRSAIAVDWRLAVEQPRAEASAAPRASSTRSIAASPGAS